MEDRNFFEHIYQLWTRTTGAENQFWMPEAQNEDEPIHFNIYAVGQEEVPRKHVASFLTDEDAEFITGVHGCFKDLIGRLIDACDEADRLDCRVDEQTSVIAELCEKNQRLIDENIELSLKVVAAEEAAELEREQAEFWRSHK